MWHVAKEHPCDLDSLCSWLSNPSTSAGPYLLLHHPYGPNVQVMEMLRGQVRFIPGFVIGIMFCMIHFARSVAVRKVRCHGSDHSFETPKE
jgi:hypothetical protein